MPDVLITEFMADDQVARLSDVFDVAYRPDLVNSQEDIPPLMAGVRGLIIRNQTQARGDVLDQADKLIAVGRLGVGLDNIDMKVCAARGIDVFPATGANADSVAELAMGAIFAMFRRTYRSTEDVIEGRWPRMDLMGREVSGKVLGILGLGATGKALAWRARGCGMRVTAWDPYVPAEDSRWGELQVERVDTLEALLGASDAVSIHIPLTEETTHLINADAISKMKDRALLLNLARGGIVHEGDLAAALTAGHLAAAFTDVYEEEPLSANNVFHGVPNLYLTPHVGARTEEAEARVSTMIAEAILTRLQADT